MWYHLKKIMCILLSSLLLQWPCCTYAASSLPEIKETEIITVLEQTLNEVESTQEILLTLLTEQEQDLNLLSEQLLSSQEQLIILKGQLITLQVQLNDAKRETNSAKDSLEKVNKELADASLSLKKLKKANDREVLLWKVLAGLLAGGLLAKSLK